MAVTILGVMVGLVTLVQGVAWLGASPVNRPRRTGWGALLAPLGYGLFALSCLRHLVPGFVD